MYSAKDFTVGSEWETRDGRKARVIANISEACDYYEIERKYLVTAVIFDENGDGEVEDFCEDGGWMPEEESGEDLVRPWDEKQKEEKQKPLIEKWVVFEPQFKTYFGCFPTKKHAQAFITAHYPKDLFIPLKITGTEGEE